MEGNEFYNYVKKWVVNDYKTPGIKAEVIIDMLLSEYVAEIVQNAINEGKEEKDKVVLELVSKEFPIRTLTGDAPNFQVNKTNRNAKVDYLLASKKPDNSDAPWQPEKLYFVELKTTKDSFDDDQLKRMIYSAATAKDSLEFYKKASGTKLSKGKYGKYEGIMDYKVNAITGKLVEVKNIDIISQTPSIECVYLTMRPLQLKDSEVIVGGKTYKGYLAKSSKTGKGIPIWVVDFMKYKQDPQKNEDKRPNWETIRAIFEEAITTTTGQQSGDKNVGEH